MPLSLLLLLELEIKYKIILSSGATAETKKTVGILSSAQGRVSSDITFIAADFPVDAIYIQTFVLFWDR